MVDIDIGDVVSTEWNRNELGTMTITAPMKAKINQPCLERFSIIRWCFILISIVIIKRISVVNVKLS